MQSRSLDTNDISAAASSPSEPPVRDFKLTRATRCTSGKHLHRTPSLTRCNSQRALTTQDGQSAKKPGKPRVAHTFLRHLSLGNLVLAASVCTGNQRVLALLCGMRLAQWSSKRRLKVRSEQLAKAVAYVQGDASWECVGPAPRPDDRSLSVRPSLLSTDTTPGVVRCGDGGG
jgi:hypothetical protein